VGVVFSSRRIGKGKKKNKRKEEEKKRREEKKEKENVRVDFMWRFFSQNTKRSLCGDKERIEATEKRNEKLAT